MTPSSPPNILEDFSAFVNLINEIQVSSLTLWHDKSKNGNFLGITHEGVTFAYFIGQFESASDYWDAQQYGIDKPKDLIEHREVAEIGWPNIYTTQSFKKAFGEKEPLPPYDPLMVLFQDWKSSGRSAWHFWKISQENGWEGPSQIVQFAFSKDQFRKYLLDQFYNEIGCYKSLIGDYVRTTMLYLSFCPYENRENWLKGYPDFVSFHLALQNYRYYDQQKRKNEPREERSEERGWGNSYQELPPYDPLVVYDFHKVIGPSPDKTIILGIQELWMTANKNGWKNIDAIKDTLMEKLPEELFDNKRILRHFSTYSEEPEESTSTRKKQKGKKRMREILERIFPWDNITRLAERFATVGPEKAKEIHITLTDEGDLLATMGGSEIPL